jgi:hypothetical protein
VVVLGVPIIGSQLNNDVAVKTPLYLRDLSCAHLEPLWLQAQSVPTTSQVPCLSSLPAGWTLTNVAVNDGRSVITLAHDRAGADAVVVRLTATCDPRGATEVISGQPGARRYMRIERLAPQSSATRFDVFAGGCVTTRLTAPAAYRAQLTSEAASLLSFTTRAQLRQALDQRSGGRLELDPGTTP